MSCLVLFIRAMNLSVLSEGTQEYCNGVSGGSVLGSGVKYGQGMRVRNRVRSRARVMVG